MCFLRPVCLLRPCGSATCFPLAIVLLERIGLTAQLICFHLRCSAELCEQLWEPTSARSTTQGRRDGQQASREAPPGGNWLEAVEVTADWVDSNRRILTSIQLHWIDSIGILHHQWRLFFLTILSIPDTAACHMTS